jgi:hypothetical protein
MHLPLAVSHKVSCHRESLKGIADQSLRWKDNVLLTGRTMSC